jgi:hypothetical protein
MSRRTLILIAVLAVPLSLMVGPAVQAAVAQGGSTVVVTPSSGPPGSTVNASGANWTAGDQIQAEWGDDDSNLGSPVVVAADGTFTDSFAIPSDATPGSHQVLFWDEQGRYFEVADFDVTGASSPPPTSPPPSCPAPSVSFTPATGPVGTTFSITGSNWVPGGTVTSTLPYGSPGWFTGYQTPTVDANGGFSYKETVGTGPSGPTPPGTYTITYAEKSGDCSLSFHQTFTVTSSHPSPPGIGTPPTAPSNLTATAISQNDIRLNWHDNSNNQAGFEISNGVISTDVGANSTTYTWGDLAPGTYMCFKIRAYNSIGDSAWYPDFSPWYVCTTTPKHHSVPKPKHHRVPTFTWGDYLTYLEQFYSGLAGANDSLDCISGGSTGSFNALVAGCLSLLWKDAPPAVRTVLSTAFDGLKCFAAAKSGSDDAIAVCLSARAAELVIKVIHTALELIPLGRALLNEPFPVQP